MSQHQYADLAHTIQRHVELGRICGLVGEACRQRVLAIARLLAAGRLDPDRALRLAREAEALSVCFAPLPSEDQP